MQSQPLSSTQKPYRQHPPLVIPVVYFHGRVLKTFDQLPTNGKLLEIAKRVVTLVIAPLAYLVLGAFALLGMVIGAKTAKASTPKKEPLVLSASDKIRLQREQQLRCESAARLARTKLYEHYAIDNIASLSIFMVSFSKTEKNVVLQKVVRNPQEDYVFENTLIGISNSLEEQVTHYGSKVQWKIFVKEKNGEFSDIGSEISSKTAEVSGSVHKSVPMQEHLREYFKIYSEGFGRSENNLLDDNNEFIEHTNWN